MKYAFYDVDETLINMKSMFDFLKYYCLSVSNSSVDGINKYSSMMESIKNLSHTESREVINQFYYQYYAGVEEGLLIDIGNSWWNSIDKNDVFNNRVLSTLIKHRDDGYQIILVSGSMTYCIDPMKEYLNVKHSILTELEVKDRYLTGKLIGEPNIGVNKSKNILNYLARHRMHADLNNSYAYADHISDLSMLQIVGNPVVVGSNIEMIELANLNGWKTIPADITAPLEILI